MAQEFVSTREAAKQLGVALRTVQLWVESGVLRAWKTAGGHRRIAVDSLQALLAKRQAATGDEEIKPPAPESAPTAGATVANALRVLVVEDDPGLRTLMMLVMRGWPFPAQISTANNGYEGLIKIGEAPPDLLISDLNMPGMDGFQMIAALRKHPSTQHLPIVVMTALSPEEIAFHGGLPGDIRVFTKPVDFVALETLASQVWRVKQQV
ncbi:excisionase family DNA binding protein [Chitinivorax tropicus]|uniref:Excisionase family DNA binding protein n=1 Tax=Chitinivorax tropicus TaxID=714531 RepID=A0A840MIA6_9PROT|nr:response regulator [Chitinivorax tropicus]MBB5017255.1 excisionase family DNA binding protein [Chitinivorax tropicus]